jgi:hypothetical protein
MSNDVWKLNCRMSGISARLSPSSPPQAGFSNPAGPGARAGFFCG